MGSVPPKPRSTASTVCIIGAGASGLAAAKYLLAEQAFSRIAIYEQRSRVGGLWNHTTSPEQARNEQQVPQVNPSAEPEKPLHRSSIAAEPRDDGIDGTQFVSPIYDRLEANVPRGLMGFSSLDWPDDCPLFPKHGEVLKYVESYANDVRHLIHFSTQVVDVRLDEEDKWVVQTQRIGPDDAPGAFATETFDSVVVASGHFDTTYIPSVKGIEDWNKTFPTSISHSKFYRRPEDFSDKKVVVVGNSASGVDIAAQIATTSKGPVLVSQKSESSFLPEPSPTQIQKPEITEFIIQDRTLRFSDGSLESEIDAVVYCTGYLYSFPFLQSLKPALITTGERVHHLYQHLFYREHPTLVFPVLVQKVIPFPLAEAQSAVFARVFAGRLDLPEAEEMKTWEEQTLQQNGDGRKFHVLQYPKDAKYINSMHDWAISARDEETHASINKGRSSPPYWHEEEIWVRERRLAINKAFQSFGSARHQKRTLEDVGYDFNAWKREQA